MKKLLALIYRRYGRVRLYRGFHRPSQSTGYIISLPSGKEIFLGGTIEKAVGKLEQDIYS